MHRQVELMGLTGEIKLDVLGFRTSFHLDLIEKVRTMRNVLFTSPLFYWNETFLHDLYRSKTVLSQLIDCFQVKYKQEIAYYWLQKYFNH